MPNIDHTNCGHESTTEARKACRDLRETLAETIGEFETLQSYFDEDSEVAIHLDAAMGLLHQVQLDLGVFEKVST